MRMLRRLSRVKGLSLLRVSGVYRNRAEGKGVKGSFFNGVALACSPLPPLSLLGSLKRVERSLGRKGKGGDRPADLDLLLRARAYAWRSFRHPKLLIPHPRLRRRTFVLFPLAQLLPSLPLPLPATVLASLRRAAQRKKGGYLGEGIRIGIR